jgi:hypothetical protein
VSGTTHLNLKAAVVFGAGGGVDAGVDGSAGGGGLSSQFDSAATSGTAACNPTLVYPNDNALIPPNTNVLEVHFKEGTPANKLFEISFKNKVTDVRVYSTCTGATPDVGTQIGGGCVFALSQAEWDYVAKTNRDGDPVAITVKGLGCDPAGAAGVSNTRNIAFARDDMRGTLYYWSSIRLTGGNVFSGGVYRYDYGVRGQTAEPVLTPTSGANPTGLCIGCHDISRDGRQMVFDFDDNDADDEYGDVFTDIYDIAAAKAAVPIIKNGANVFPPGYHTWNRSTQQFLLSDGPGDTGDAGKGLEAGAFRRVTPDAGTAGFTKPGGLRGTTPDWAPDDSNVVFAVPPNVFNNTNAPACGYWMKQQGPRDDLMFACASLYTSPWNAATNTLGNPTALLTATGNENYYYPSYSPEGSLIVYNHTPSGSNFHNPLARIEVVANGQATPTRDYLTALNVAPSSDTTTNMTNSWARWAPFVQTYKGQKLLWVTFSSTRNYGLRIDNTGLQNCYPKESPQYVVPDFSSNPTPGCTRTQLWMAAIKLDASGVQAGTDVSFPAFYLPFQDITTNNHLAQWAQKSFQGTCKTDPDCSGQPGKCCDNGGCTTCESTTPPNATCATTPNCPTNQCCNSGACGACAPGQDAGGPRPNSCTTCLDCAGQACGNDGTCGSCTSSAQCCAPLICVSGSCIADDVK